MPQSKSCSRRARIRRADTRARSGLRIGRICGNRDRTRCLTENIDVLIAGAGPTGLVLALWLAKLGVRARIVDKTAEPGTTSRALAVQGRTLELYGQIGLAGAVVERGRKVVAANLWVSGN